MISLAVGLFFCLSLQATEPFVYNQDLRLRYMQSGMTGQDDNSSGTLNYRFTLGFPLITYRLGSVALTGSLDYHTLKLGIKNDSDVGLKSYGMNINLFPYRRFHLGFYYSRSESPKLLTEHVGETTRYGLYYSLLIPRKPQIYFKADRTESIYLGEKDRWDRFQIKGIKRSSKSNFQFQLNRDDYFVERDDAGVQWHSDYGFAQYEKSLPADWASFSIASASSNGSYKSLNLNSTVFGKAGKLLLSSGVSFGIMMTDEQDNSKNFSLSQSVAIPLEKTTYFSSLAVSHNSMSGYQPGTGSRTDFMAIAGLVNKIGGNMQVAADVVVNHRSFTGASGDSRVFHLGISEGGLLPQIIQRTIFSITEAPLNKRLKLEYPPGYIPPDVSLEILNSRQIEIGNQSFSADYFRFDSDEDGKRDYFKAEGRLHLNRHFETSLKLEYIKEDDGKDYDSRAGYAYLQNRLKMGRNHLGFSVGITDGDYSYGGYKSTSSRSTSYSISFSSRIGRVPFGAIYRCYSADGEKYKNIYFYQSCVFRKIAMRTGYEQTYFQNNRKSYRFTFEIARSFDSLLLFGNRFLR